MLLICFVIVPIFAGVFFYILPKKALRTGVFATQISLAFLLVYCYMSVVQSGKISVVLGANANNPTLGIVLIADRLTLIFVLLSICLFFIAFLYSMKESHFDKKFAMLFFMLQGLLCGVFLTDDLFNIFVLLEVATVIVAILIMFKRDSRSVYDGLIYLLSQVVCMVFYLFGVGYMYKIFGVLSLEKIAELMPLVPAESLIMPYAFIMTAVCLKSAFFPLFSWLPRAHGTPSAPSAVSAILSGLYVKNGIYLFLIFSTLFAPKINYQHFFVVIASITAVLGFVFAAAQTDIKLILAYSTVSQMGLIALGLSVGTEVARWGAIYHILNHAVFKSLLFLCAGMVIKRYKTRDITKVHGVLRTMPVTGMGIIISALGITGAPFFNGSVSKYFMQYGAEGTLAEYIIILINLGTMILLVKYTSMLWGGAQTDTVPVNRRCKSASIVILSAFCVAGGVFGVWFMQNAMGAPVDLDIAKYAQKGALYFLYLALAVIIYKFAVSKNKVLLKLNTVSLNFQQIVMAMLAFFICVTVSAHFSVV